MAHCIQTATCLLAVLTSNSWHNQMAADWHVTGCSKMFKLLLNTKLQDAHVVSKLQPKKLYFCS